MDAKAVALTADEVLRVFHHDEIDLFLGAAFATVGIVAGAISFFGRKFDPLLLWLAIFAILYGNRLWLQTDLLALMVPDSLFFRSLRASANYLVPSRHSFTSAPPATWAVSVEMLVYPLPASCLLRDGQVREVAENGLMLGAFDTATYGMAVHRLQPGDRLVLYTDGIMEAANGAAEEFGRERLSALLRDAEALSHDSVADLILTTVQRWSASQEDDLTVLVCDFQRS
jgi:hypothetical protein